MTKMRTENLQMSKPVSKQYCFWKVVIEYTLTEKMIKEIYIPLSASQFILLQIIAKKNCMPGPYTCERYAKLKFDQ